MGILDRPAIHLSADDMLDATAPDTTGFWWAKWRAAAAETRDAALLTPSNEWEVMQVVENGIRPTDADWLMALVPGVEALQPLRHFTWGPRVPFPAVLAGPR